jgi:glycosyltransferase involved in cell wall biosynthesis
MDEETATPTSKDQGTQSAVVFGYMSSYLGVGESARLLMMSLDAAGVSATSIPVEEPWGTSRWATQNTATRSTDFRFLCFNADQTPVLATHSTVRGVKSSYTIGVWHWEVEVFPDKFKRAFEFVDEVWAGSTFSAQSIGAKSSKPVMSMPPAVVAPHRLTSFNRTSYGLPPGFMFLFMFDHRSVISRKNPYSVIEAFSRAFSPGEGPILVIKSVNGSRFLAEHSRLLAATAGRADVKIIDREMTEAEVASLVHGCDAYVSLHRAEGFGLTIAEAAACAKPVISTGYSGPMEFLTPENSFLIPFDLVPIGSGQEPYPAHARWAEPDVSVAAEAMRTVWKNPEAARIRGERAQKDVVGNHGPLARGAAISSRLKEVALHSPSSSPVYSARDHRLEKLRVMAERMRVRQMVRRTVRPLSRAPNSER